jgi:hypothetical protein
MGLGEDSQLQSSAGPNSVQPPPWPFPDWTLCSSVGRI